MAISSPGLGSGLNITSIVSQLVAVESQPVQLLQKKGTTLQTQMSVFGQIKSELSTLKDAASALNSVSTWSSVALTSSDTSITGSTTTGAQAAKYAVAVTDLAQVQKVVGASTFTATQTMGGSGGTLTFYSGAYTSTTDPVTKITTKTSFVSKNPSTGNLNPYAGQVSVASTDTLADVVTKINAQSTTLGVTASIVTSAGAQRLVLRGNSTGTDAAFQIDADTAGLYGLSYLAVAVPMVDKGGAPITPTATSTMTLGQDAKNANVTIDGIAVTSQTNSISDALTGVTLNVSAKTPSPVDVTVSPDTTSMKTKIQAFQDAYNKLYADLKTQMAYDPATKTGGPLLGDNTAAGLQNMLRSLVGAVVPSTTSSISRLSNLGLEIQSDGSLKANSTKLDAALQDPNNVKAFFSSSTGLATEHGIARRIYDFAFGALGVDGNVSTHSTAFQKSIDQNNATIDKFNLHIAAYQKQLLAQYTALDTNMSKLNSLSTYVTQQLAQWNKTS